MSAEPGTCERMPEGWFCTLDANHDGPCPAWPDSARWHTYGDDPEGGRNTIHGTTWLDIELQGGKVRRVWFRCMTLPFKLWERDAPRGSGRDDPPFDDDKAIRAVVVEQT